VPVEHGYRLQSAAYELDDGAPGIELANGQSASGALAHGIDVVDLYHFSVPRTNQLTKIDLEQKPNVGFDLVLQREDGTRVACACNTHGRQVIRRQLVPGRYFAVLRGGGGIEGAADGAGHVGKPRWAAQIEIDRLDPLFGWQFAQELTGNVGAGGTYVTGWTPPWIGYWRARARFLGTEFSNFSESGYVRVHVVKPLE
jgi:hypothetical protein